MSKYTIKRTKISMIQEKMILMGLMNKSIKINRKVIKMNKIIEQSEISLKESRYSSVSNTYCNFKVVRI